MANNDDKKPIKFEVLEGLATYCFIHQPDKGNPKFRIPPAYKVDLQLPDEGQLKKAKSLNLPIKSPDGNKFKDAYVSIKSKVQEGRLPPKLVDSQGNVIPKNILVGNGSKVRVRFLPFTYGEGEVTPILQEIQVITLVPYVPTSGEMERKGSFFEKVEGGFVVPPGAPNEVNA